MKKKIEIEESTARRLYVNASPEIKEMLEETFGKDLFSKKITDCKTYEEVCSHIGEKPINEEEFLNLGFTQDEIDYRKLKTIIKAYNEGWIGDYNNTSQKKWIPWFNFTPSGVRFSFSDCNDSIASAGRAARLCLKDEATSDAFGKNFTELCAKFIN